MESVTFSVTLCMRFRTIFSCFSINYVFAFLAYFVIDALRFRNKASSGPSLSAKSTTAVRCWPVSPVISLTGSSQF